MNAVLDNRSLSQEWQAWIVENLARGCSVTSLTERMVLNHFDAAVARESIARALHDATSIAPYGYETSRFPATGNVIHTPDRNVRVSARVFKPVVAVLDDLLSAEECDELIRLSRIKLKRSTTVDPVSGQETVIKARTSYGAFFAANETEFIATLEKRIAAVMHWPAENGEGLQILNYQVGAEYKPHYDYFPPADPGSAAHLAKGGQRVSTLVMYLNDVQAAGETTFPEVGLSVTPKKGSAVYFEYCNSKGQVDPLSLHCGVPVVAGEKWIATKWMRQGRYE
ncbi:MAG: 2OG-Fe(II) oxygenase [Rhodoferax sp.]|nr:2OG-Fe(II) oxygenase [Rhodoferax sp.]MBP7491185.1 2OG-Fe(II) oxygenase [Rhodoferax sp.]